MRIISQSKMDFPYEHIVVYTDENSVMCKTLQDGKKYCLGVYKDCERANKVFENIYLKNEIPYLVNPIENGVLLHHTFIMPEE